MAGRGAPPRGTPATAGGGSQLWLQGLGCGLVVTVAASTALLLGVLLAPALLATLIDRAPSRPTARILLIFGAALAANPMTLLWRGINTFDGAIHLAADLRVTALAWAAQAVGWLLAELAPLMIRLGLEARDRARAARLRAARARFEETWGLPPAGGR